MNPNLLTHAQLALERNNFFEANRLFRLHVTHYPNVIAGWLGLFQSSPQQTERIECLDQLLRVTRAEGQAAVESPKEAVGAGRVEVVQSAPLLELEVIQPHSQIAPIKDESPQNLGNELYEYDVIKAADVQIESGWPAFETQIVQWTTEMVAAGNRLMQVIDTELVPAAIALKHTLKSHLVFTTQFSTQGGRKLRLMPSQRKQKLPGLLNWTGWVVGVLLLGLVAAVVVPVLLGSRAYVIVSGSMVPTFATGSVVMVRSVQSSQLQVGDVIAYSPHVGAIPIVHRIISIRAEDGARFFTTQGDANAVADPNEVTLPASTWQLWYSLPWLGYIINIAFSKIGVVLFILVPLVGLGVLTLKDKLRPPLKPRLLRANS